MVKTISFIAKWWGNSNFSVNFCFLLRLTLLASAVSIKNREKLGQKVFFHDFKEFFSEFRIFSLNV